MVEDLERAGELAEAGGAEAVEALVEDRPALRQALGAARVAVAGMAPVEDEPMVEVARTLLR